jgi:hypothetical protein
MKLCGLNVNGSCADQIDHADLRRLIALEKGATDWRQVSINGQEGEGLYCTGKAAEERNDDDRQPAGQRSEVAVER